MEPAGGVDADKELAARRRAKGKVADVSAEEAAQQIILYLQRKGYVGTNGG